MANYKKSLNLRYGVQVDDDNFVVNSNGAVGIGTSIPTALLDIRGNVKVVGITTSDNLYAGIATVGVLSVTQNANITGNVTANTFYGSAAGLTGIYAIAVNGWYVSAGSISTITTKIGVGTTDPQYQLQIGGDPSTSFGIGADSLGNIVISGVTTIVNSLGVSGITTTTNLRVSGLATITSLNVTGVATVPILTITTSATVPTLTVGSNLSGKDVTLTNNLKSPTLNVTGITTTNNLSVTGIATIGTLGVTGLTTTRDLRVIGVATIGTLGVTGLTTTQDFRVIGVATIGTLGVTNDITGSSNLYLSEGTGTLGIGTVSILTNTSLQIDKPGTSAVLIRSDLSESVISIGRSNSLTDFNGAIRFGNTNGSFTYSDSQSFDIMNYNRGNINFHLNAGTAGINTGSFHWHRGIGPKFLTLMTLTPNGNLGIGFTNPVHKLHVQGISTFTNSAFFNSNVTIDNNLTVRNDLTIQDGDVSLSNGSATLSAKYLKGNIVSPSGTTLFSNGTGSGNDALSRVNFLVNSGVSTASSIQLYSLGINSPLGIIGETGDPKTVVFINNKILGDNDIPGGQIVIDEEGNVGIGTTRSIAGLDLRYLAADSTLRFIILPLVSTTERASLQAVQGSLIYNKTTNRLQFYTGSSWVGIATTSA